MDAAYGAAFPSIPADPTFSTQIQLPRTTVWSINGVPYRSNAWVDNFTYSWGGGGGYVIDYLELPVPNYPVSTLSTIDCTSTWYGGGEIGMRYRLNTNPVTVDFYTYPSTTTATASGSNATTTATTSAESYSLKSSIDGTVEIVTTTVKPYAGIYPYDSDGNYTYPPGSEINLTGKFWVVPAGYVGGSVLEDFPTISAATIKTYTVHITSTWWEYSSSLSTRTSSHSYGGYYNEYYHWATSEAYLVATSHSEIRTAVGGYENIWNISHNEAMLAFDGTTFAGGIYRYAGSYGASLSTENFSPRLSCLHGDTQGFPAISEVVSYSALEGNEAGYMILGSTNIIALTTAGSDSHVTTSTFSLQLLSPAESSQSIDNYWNGPVIRAGKYGGDDYKAILAGGQDWSASLYAGSNDTFRVYENPSSGSTNSYSFAVNEGWFSNFSAESGGNIVVVGGRYIPPVVEYYEEDGSYRTRYATAARTIS